MSYFDGLAVVPRENDPGKIKEPYPALRRQQPTIPNPLRAHSSIRTSRIRHVITLL